jgi:hypothetical protein
MLGALPFVWSRTLTELLPGNSALILVTEEAPVPMTTEAALVTLSTWAVVAAAAGAWRLLRSDVHH